MPSPHQHEIQAIEGGGALQRGLIGGRFHHGQLRGIAPGIGASGANFLLGEGVAARAVAHAAGGGIQRAGQLQRAFAVVLEQVKGHALG